MIVIFDRKIPIDLPGVDVEIVWIEDFQVPKLYELAFMYDVIEFTTSLKPFIAMKLLESHDSVIFLDPDTCIFSSIEPILADLAKYSIVLTPHYTTPHPRQVTEPDFGMMRFGSFNLGFFAVKGSSVGLAFLKWWSDRCIDYGFMESQFGLSVDQKWVSIAPCFFKDLHVSFNLGYNVAPWNTFEREITPSGDGGFLVNGDFPLVFFHFSEFDIDDPGYRDRRRPSIDSGRQYPALEVLGIAYREVLMSAAQLIGDRKYAFDSMSDGSYISPTLRRAYAAVRMELPENHDPFDSRGPVGSFARKNFLVARKLRPYAYPKLAEAENHQFAFRIIYFLMRRLLRVFGPNRFYDLSKLMIYLSLYRRNRRLWKL